MRDVDDRDAEIVAQGLEQVDDRHAQRGIDHRDRLVGDDQFRVGQQRAGDRDPLQLAAGELVRITAAHLRERQADLAQGASSAASTSRPSPAPREPAPRQRADSGRALQRVEGLEGVLEDRLHLVHEAPCASAPRRSAADPHPSSSSAPLRRRLDVQDHPRQRGLAAAGFADDRQDLRAVAAASWKLTSSHGAIRRRDNRPPRVKVLLTLRKRRAATLMHVCPPLTAKQATRCSGASLDHGRGPRAGRPPSPADSADESGTRTADRRDWAARPQESLARASSPMRGRLEIRCLV